jgi:hypothetical protein
MQQKNSLRFEAWNRLLPASVEDRDFILNGVKDGFNLSVIYGPHLPVDRDNYTSAFRFRSAVEKQIKLEIELINHNNRLYVIIEINIKRGEWGFPTSYIMVILCTMI